MFSLKFSFSFKTVVYKNMSKQVPSEIQASAKSSKFNLPSNKNGEIQMGTAYKPKPLLAHTFAEAFSTHFLGLR